jgi:hypothetical protein
MSFIELITALAIFGFFLAGFSQVFFPVYSAWERARGEYRTGQTIHFVAESFKNECAKIDRNIEAWKRSLAVAKEVESCEVFEIKEGAELKGLKAVCVISGEQIEIIGKIKHDETVL